MHICNIVEWEHTWQQETCVLWPPSTWAMLITMFLMLIRTTENQIHGYQVADTGYMLSLGMLLGKWKIHSNFQVWSKATEMNVPLIPLFLSPFYLGLYAYSQMYILSSPKLGLSELRFQLSFIRTNRTYLFASMGLLCISCMEDFHF